MGIKYTSYKISDMKYWILAIMLTIDFIEGTAYSKLFPDIANILWKVYACMRIVFLPLLVHKATSNVTKKYFIITFVYLIIVACTYFSSGYWVLFDTFFVAIVFQDEIDVDRIVNLFFRIYTIGSIITFAGYILGFLPDQELKRANRLLCGFVGPNRVGAIFLAISLLYILKRKKIKLIDIFVLYLIAAFLIIVPNSRASALCVIMLATIELLKIIRITVSGQIISPRCIKIMVFSLIGIICFWVYLSIKTGFMNGFLYNYYETMYSRFNMGRIGLEQYGLSLFGKKVTFIGELDAMSGRGAYFTLDCMYVYLPILCGVASTVFYFFIFISAINNCIKKNKMQLVEIGAILIIYALFENVVAGIVFSFFYICAMSKE